MNLVHLVEITDRSHGNLLNAPQNVLKRAPGNRLRGGSAMKWASEADAVAYFQRRGWVVNSHRGALGIVFHRVGQSKTIYQDGGFWRVAV